MGVSHPGEAPPPDQQQVALRQGVLREPRLLHVVAPPFSTCRLPGHWRKRKGIEYCTQRLSWTSAAHCSVVSSHLIARDSGKCSLTAQGKEKMRLGKEVFPGAPHVCSGPWWHAHCSWHANACTQAQTQAQSQRFTYTYTCLFRLADMHTHMLRCTEVRVHTHVLRDMTRCTEAEPQRGVLLRVHTRVPPPLTLTPPLLCGCFWGEGHHPSGH